MARAPPVCWSSRPLSLRKGVADGRRAGRPHHLRRRLPSATRWPSRSTTTWSLSSTSSIRCVAHRTPMPSVATSLRMVARMPARDWMSSPTVASSSSSRGGRCSSARAISMRRIWPPERLRALSCRRSLMSTVLQAAPSMRAPRLARADAVQRGVVGKVLVDAEVEVERARLEHDAEAPQRLAGGARRCRGRRCGSSRGGCCRDG